MSEPIAARGDQPEIIGQVLQHPPVSAVQLPLGLTVEIDAWASDRQISRSEAIRRLVEIGLGTTGK